VFLTLAATSPSQIIGRPTRRKKFSALEFHKVLCDPDVTRNHETVFTRTGDSSWFAFDIVLFELRKFIAEVADKCDVAPQRS
jgi:hypothetical protein